MKKEYIESSRKLLDFIEKSPSCYHVIKNIQQSLTAEGFTELREEQSWKIKAGGKYFVTRNGSSIIAFYVPSSDFTNFQIIASHSDSPSFKIKENPEIFVDGHYVELNVEKYGGMIFAPWFDRPLSVAGKIVVKTDKGFEEKLVNIDRDLVMIPNLAIHMNRDVNDGYKYNAQKDMIPLFGDEKAKGQFMQLIAECAGAKEQDVLGSDLFLYNRVPGTIWGADNEFISSGKIDDLQCAYSTVLGFTQAVRGGKNKKSVSVACVFDNEEVGSGTKQGADSTFLSDVLERICALCKKNPVEEYKMAVADSFMLSADNAHAAHPNYLEKADPVNRPYMNCGIVIKFNANQKYTTDSVSAAVMKGICEKSGVPYQVYVNRSDIAGGSTLGNIANAHVSLNTVDIGLSQLAMHSPYETAGVKDTLYMTKAAQTFFSTHIEKDSNGFGFY